MAKYTVSTKDEEQEADLEFDLDRMNQGKESEDQMTKGTLLQLVVDSHLHSVRDSRSRTLEAVMIKSILEGQSGPERDLIIEKVKKARGKK